MCVDARGGRRKERDWEMKNVFSPSSAFYTAINRLLLHWCCSGAAYYICGDDFRCIYLNWGFEDHIVDIWWYSGIHFDSPLIDSLPFQSSYFFFPFFFRFQGLGLPYTTDPRVFFNDATRRTRGRTLIEVAFNSPLLIFQYIYYMYFFLGTGGLFWELFLPQHLYL